MRARAFSIVEFMVLFGILVILLSIFVPYLLRLREIDRRVRCAGNLRQIRDALGVYAQGNGHMYPRVVYDDVNLPNGYTAFTGADCDNPFAANAAVKPNDVTASLWLLVRLNLLDAAVFVCPSASGDARDLLTDANGRFVKPIQRGNFRDAGNLSYSYSSPFSAAPGYRMDDTRKGDFALLADKSPGNGIDALGEVDRADSITGPAWNADVVDRSRANSQNHGKAGQNVLFADGSVNFERSAFCGVGRGAHSAGDTGGDNIYTALAESPLNGEKPPANGNGFWAHDIGPSWEGDSYLVPTADDGPGTAVVTAHRHNPTSATTPAPATEPLPATVPQPPTSTTGVAAPAATTLPTIAATSPATLEGTGQPPASQPATAPTTGP